MTGNTNAYSAFGTGTGANVMTSAAWAALATRLTGFQSGIASSAQVNTAIRQASVVATMIAQFTADFGSSSVNDDGNIAALESNFEAALSAYIASALPARTRLLANMTIFVNASTGNDSTGNGTSGAPYQTLQHARNIAQQTLDLAGQYSVTYNCTGAFTAGVSANGPLIGQQSPANEVFSFVSGSSITTTNISCISGASSSMFTVLSQSGTITISTIGTSPYTSCIISSSGSNIVVGSGINFGSSIGYHIAAQQSSSISIQGIYNVSGGVGQSHVFSELTSTITYATTGTFVISITGSPVINVWASVLDDGIIQCLSANYSFSGSPAVGCKRYSAIQGGWIDSGGGGASFFPGSVAGTGSNIS